MKINSSLFRSSMLRASCITFVIFSLFMLSFAITYGLDQGEVLYKIEKSSDGSNLIVETMFIGNESGNTDIYFAKEAHATIEMNSLSGTAVTFKADEAVPCSRASQYNKCTKLSLTHEPSDQIRLTHTLPIIEGKSTVINPGANTVMSSGAALFFEKSVTLIFPELNDKKRKKISVDWPNLDMQNARIVFRKKVHDMSSAIQIDKDEFFDGGYFLFSNDTIYNSKLNTNPGIMFVSVGLPEKSKDPQIATRADFAAIIKKIWSYNQKFVDNILPEKLKGTAAQEKVVLLIKY